jgi:L-ribulose-5-phosphate 4-epimerase
MLYQDEREQLLETVQFAYNVDLIRMSAGNISTRTADGNVAITPSGIKYHSMNAEDISIVDLECNLLEGPKPSSEIPMHTAIYQNISRAISICHTHSIYGMVFAMLQEDIPLMNVELMGCGAPIPVAPWASPGTAKAGEVTVNIFQARPELSVILLRQHGLVAIGNSLDQALEKAYNAETGLETYYKSQLLGTPQPFSREQINEIKETYGL